MRCSRLSNVHAWQRRYIFNRMASPMLKEKQQPANGTPPRGYRSTGSHPRRGRRPRRPGNFPSPPIPGKTPGPGMPGPYRAAAGMPPAVRKRPRRGQDPSLRTAPSTSADPPPQVRAAARQRAATRVGGGVPDAPETSRHRPSPGKPPGRACPAPTARRRASPLPSINAHGGVKTPPYGPTPPTSAHTPPQVRAAARQRAVTHVGGGGPDAPETSRCRPSPGTPPGPGMPGPYRAAAGKPYTVRKRPRRGQDPSLRTAPSTSVRPYSAYVNYIRRAGCPHPAASSRGYRSTGSHPRRGRRPRRPENLPSPPVPGKTPGPGMPGPYRAAVGKSHAVHKRPRRGQDPSLRTAPSTSARPPTARRGGNGDKKTEAIPFPGTASVLYISI